MPRTDVVTLTCTPCSSLAHEFCTGWVWCECRCSADDLSVDAAYLRATRDIMTAERIRTYLKDVGFVDLK